ncbi:Uncharacterised protein [uncultured archaeon]|nr:Uncharacterised protein [uncultured archaeon]
MKIILPLSPIARGASMMGSTISTALEKASFSSFGKALPIAFNLPNTIDLSVLLLGAK